MSEEGYLGCTSNVFNLRARNNKLNEQVLEKINATQELVLINDYAKEANEYLIKKSLQNRISDISSWRWVLEDLSKRLDETISALNHEIKAVKVVVQRIKNEIEEHSVMWTKPGALCPQSDSVEEAINKEYFFLKQEKKKFETLVVELEKEVASIQKTKKRIQNDILLKKEAISVEESVYNIDLNTLNNGEIKDNKKKRGTPLTRWENRCMALKKDGLKAICRSIVIRQQVRGARVHLSIMSEAHTSKVDSALRRRLHANNTKLNELQWQKQEASRDLRALDEELLATEQSLVSNLEQEKVIRARMIDRSQRPSGELIKDEVDRTLKDEFIRSRRFVKDLRQNLDSIICLQNKLKDSIYHIDCAQVDLDKVIQLDQERMMARLGQLDTPSCHSPLSLSPQGSALELSTMVNMPSEMMNLPTSSISEGTGIPGAILPQVSTGSLIRPSSHDDDLHNGYLPTIREEDEDADEDNHQYDVNDGSDGRYDVNNKTDDEDDGLDDYPFDY